MTRFEYNFLLGLLWWLKQGLCVYQLPCSGLLEKKYKRHCMLSKFYTELHLGQLASCFQDLLVWPTRSFHGLSICLVLVVFTLLTSSLLLKKALHLLSSRRRWSWLTNGLSSYTNSHTRLHLLEKRFVNHRYSHRCLDDVAETTEHSHWSTKSCSGLLIETSWSVLIEKSGSSAVEFFRLAVLNSNEMNIMRNRFITSRLLHRLL